MQKEKIEKNVDEEYKVENTSRRQRNRKEIKQTETVIWLETKKILPQCYVNINPLICW